MIEGKIVRVSGPVIYASGLGGAGLYDVVEAGHDHLAGEIIRMEGAVATIQIYEENTGMKPGEPVVSFGRPLSALLGPGILGSIYDGIQRPLERLKASGGAFLQPGVKGESLDRSRKWQFVPVMKAGDPVVQAKFQ